MVQVTLVRPTGKRVPDAGVQVTPGAVNPTVVPCGPAASTEIFPGSVSVGPGGGGGTGGGKLDPPARQVGAYPDAEQQIVLRVDLR